MRAVSTKSAPTYECSAYGLSIRANALLPSMHETTVRSEGDGFMVELVSRSEMPGLERIGEEADSIVYDILSSGDVYVSVPTVFEAIIQRDGSAARCAPLMPVDDPAFETNVLHSLVAIALMLRGEETLHATVVAIEDKAVALLGPSGCGKSTLAASLVARGAQLVTDDVLRIRFDKDATHAFCGPVRLKLFEDSAKCLSDRLPAMGRFNRLSGKLLFDVPGSQTRQAYPLAALVWLGDSPSGTGIEVERITGTDVLGVMLRSAMVSRHLEVQRLGRQLLFCGELAGRVPLYSMKYGRTFDALPDVGCRLEGLVREEHG